MTIGEEVVEDYVSFRLTLRAHPLSLLRDRLTPTGTPPPQPRAPARPAAVTMRSHPRDVRHFA